MCSGDGLGRSGDPSWGATAAVDAKDDIATKKMVIGLVDKKKFAYAKDAEVSSLESQ